jgi:hypothetical protein
MGNPADVLNQIVASRVKPLIVPDTTPTKQRGARDGTAYVQALFSKVLCEEGSYFSTTNPTPSTPIAYGSGGTQATFSDTVPFMQIINTGNPGDPTCPIVFLDYLKLIQVGGTAPASTTAVHMAIKLDNGFRASTAGTPTTNTPNCTNMNIASVAPVARVVTYAGAVATIPAASAAARLVARAMLKGGPTLLLDENCVAFGLLDPPPGGGYLATVAQYTARAPAVAIGPGQSATIHLWFTSGITNPYSYEFELGHHERA